MTADWYRWDHDRLILSVRIQPRASKSEIVGPHGPELKIRVSSPPVDGKANQHLREFLAKVCKVSASRVELLSGFNARSKQVSIRNPTRLPPGVCRVTE
jgi:hypothetical protein